MNKKLITSLVGVLFLTVGCGFTLPYRNNGNVSLEVAPSIEKGSFFSKMKATLFIERLDAECKIKRLGHVKVGKGLEIKLQANTRYRIISEFETAGFLQADRSSNISVELKTEGNGSRYLLEPYYQESYLDARLQRIDQHPLENLPSDGIDECG